MYSYYNSLKSNMESRWLVWAADTWLYMTTAAINIEQVSKSPSVSNYRRELPYLYRHGQGGRCIIDYDDIGSNILWEPYEFYLTLSNQSTQNQVLIADISGQRFSYIADAQQMNGLDFIATTIASQSDCRLVTDKCHWNGIYSNYSCSALFDSNATSRTSIQSSTVDSYINLATSNMNSVTLGYFATPDWTTPLNKTSYISNPFFTIAMVEIGAAAPNAGGVGLGSEQVTVEQGKSGYDLFFFGCETKLFNLIYTSVGGLIVSANITVINNLKLIFALIKAEQDEFCNTQIANSVYLAWFKNRSAITDTFADQYNACLLAPAASVTNAIPNIAQ